MKRKEGFTQTFRAPHKFILLILEVLIDLGAEGLLLVYSVVSTYLGGIILIQQSEGHCMVLTLVFLILTQLGYQIVDGLDGVPQSSENVFRSDFAFIWMSGSLLLCPSS